MTKVTDSEASTDPIPCDRNFYDGGAHTVRMYLGVALCPSCGLPTSEHSGSAKTKPLSELAPSPTGVDNLDTLMHDFGVGVEKVASRSPNNYGVEDIAEMAEVFNKAKAELTSLINQIVSKELEGLPKNKLHDHINDVGQRKDIAIVNYRFIEDRIAFYESKVGK